MVHFLQTSKRFFLFPILPMQEACRVELGSFHVVHEVSRPAPQRKPMYHVVFYSVPFSRAKILYSFLL